MKKPMTNDIRKKIELYVKNKLDIAPLIEDVIIKGEHLSGAIITYVNYVGEDLSGTNFSNTTLGCDNKIFTIISCKLNNCNFYGANFVGKAFVRSCEAHDCNFKNANVALADYRNTDFGDNSNFCGAIIRIDSSSGIGCIFPKSMWADLTRNWKQKIKVEE